MQYTIGDVLTFIGLISGLLISIWASLVGFALVFPHKTEHAKGHLQTAPWISLILGAAVLALGLIPAIVLLNIHIPLLTLAGWGLILSMLGLMVIGGSGLALVMGDRMQKMDRRCSQLRGLSRSAGLMVLASLVPIFGWVLSVIVWLASLGAGFQAVFVSGRRRAPQAVPPVFSSQPSAAGPIDPPEFTV
jgi:hypothetical protein